MRSLLNFIKLLRPRQWIKNLAVFAAITFSGELFNLAILEKAILAFFSFCALASATYIINDAFDIKKDRLHPYKKNRPLAAGEISLRFAIFAAILFIAFSFYLSFLVTPAFFLATIVYLVLQFSYSLVLKRVAVLDILAIAAGYILRVYAGEFATGLHISVWLLLTTISLSLFLAVGKRRSELTLISKQKNLDAEKVRQSLTQYSEKLLDTYASVFATSTFISYSLFTFLEYPRGINLNIEILLPEFLPTFLQRKWLMITIIPVVYGLMRYLQDIYEKHEGESPDKVLLSDIPLLSVVIFWAVLVIGIIYILGV